METASFPSVTAKPLGPTDLIMLSGYFTSGLAHRNYGLRENMEVAAEDEIERMKQGLNILDTIITMAPLLGILGTVLGIIDSFDLF